MTRNRHLSRMLAASLATVLLMSACSGHGGARTASQSGRPAANTLSRTHPLRVQYAITSPGEGDSGPIHGAMTVMTDGQGRVREVFNPGSYWWFIVSDGHRAVGSNEGDEPEETDPSQASVFLSPAELATGDCHSPTRHGTTTVLGFTGDVYRCANGTKIVLEHRTGLLLRVTGDGDETVATKIDTEPRFSASTFAFPAVRQQPDERTPDGKAREAVRGAALEVEGCADENGGIYPRTLPCRSNGPRLNVNYVPDGDTYTITGRSSTGHTFTYDRAAGAITETS
jgi:hypothetical protein